MSEEINAQPQAETGSEIAATVITEEKIATETTPEPIKIKVKFNHEEKEITADEAAILAQKGMNYDKIYTQYEDLKNAEEIQFFDEIAREYGIPRAEAVKTWKDQIKQQKIADTAAAEGMTPEQAELLLEGKKSRQKAEEAEREQRLREETQKQTDARLRAEEAEFHEAYPDVKDVPDDVLKKWDKGTPLIDAFEAYESKLLRKKVENLEEQLKAKTTNEENADTSMGSVASKGVSLPTELTRESIKNMTSEQRQKNMPAIMKAVKEGKFQAW